MIDGFLVAVTIVSLGMAAIMAVIAWRAIRLTRSPLPVTAEAGPPSVVQGEGADDGPDSSGWPPDERGRRNPLRAAPSQQVVSHSPAEAPWSNVVLKRTNLLAPAIGPVQLEAFAARELSAPYPQAVGENRGIRRATVAVGIGVIILATGTGAALLVSEWPTEPAVVSPAAARVATPLELVSLDSARDGGRVTVRGIVKNPTSGNRVERLQAVVFLFDKRGTYLGATQAAVVERDLPPGSASWFEVPLAAGVPVSRYRVSFRLGEAPVPYVDRRPGRATATPERSEPRTINPGLIVTSALQQSIPD